MRQIKFRAWYKESKRFLENVQDLFNDKLNFPACFADILHDDNCVVEQYTGLKDKNGVEIYEGDILHWLDPWTDKQDWLGVVIYQEAGFKLDTDFAFKNTEWVEAGTWRFDVVGNVHQNPELLEADR